MHIYLSLCRYIRPQQRTIHAGSSSISNDDRLRQHRMGTIQGEERLAGFFEFDFRSIDPAVTQYLLLRL